MRADTSHHSSKSINIGLHAHQRRFINLPKRVFKSYVKKPAMYTFVLRIFDSSCSRRHTKAKKCVGGCNKAHKVSRILKEKGFEMV